MSSNVVSTAVSSGFSVGLAGASSRFSIGFGRIKWRVTWRMK